MSSKDDVVAGVRQVAGDLRSALEQFGSASKLVDMAERQMPDARERLRHVLKLTDEAAHRTLDLVEESRPLVDEVAREARQLLSVDAANGRPALATHLEISAAHMTAVRGKLSEVLLAQGYQDLTGQIIRGVMLLVDELERALGQLIELGGLQDVAEVPSNAVAVSAYGPVVPGVAHGNAVADQQGVDDVLAALGM